MYTVNPFDHERFYLRLLLLHIKGALSFEDLRTVNGIVFPSFKDAANAQNLLSTDDEWIKYLQEVSIFQMPYQLYLFAFIANPRTF